MPIYEYHCSKCNKTLEVIQKFSDPPLRVCPECGAPEVEKVISRSAFHLKGGGWYVTDFKDKKPEKPAEKSEEKSTDKTANAPEKADKQSEKEAPKAKSKSKPSKSEGSTT